MSQRTTEVILKSPDAITRLEIKPLEFEKLKEKMLYLKGHFNFHKADYRSPIQLDVEDLSHELMTAALTDEILVTEDNVFDVLKIADYLVDQELADKCGKVLYQKFESKNLLYSEEDVIFAEDALLSLKTLNFKAEHMDAMIKVLTASEVNETWLEFSLEVVEKLLSSPSLHISKEDEVLEFIDSYLEYNKISELPDELFNTIRYKTYTFSSFSQNLLSKLTSSQLAKIEEKSDNPLVDFPRASTIGYIFLLNEGELFCFSKYFTDLFNLENGWVKIKLDTDLRKLIGPYTYLNEKQEMVNIGGQFFIDEYHIRPNDLVQKISLTDFKVRHYEKEGIETIYPGFDESKLARPRKFYGISMLNGKYVITGGSCTKSLSALNSIEIFDPATQTSEIQTSVLRTARIDHKQITVNNKVYIIGGSDDIDIEYLKSVEVYDGIEIGELSEMDVQRKHFAVLEVHNQIIVIGGEDHLGCGYMANDIEVYDIETDEWFTMKQPVPGKPKKYPVAVWQEAKDVSFERIRQLYFEKAEEERYFSSLGMEWDYELNDWVKENFSSRFRYLNL